MKAKKKEKKEVEINAIVEPSEIIYLNHKFFKCGYRVLAINLCARALG